MKKLLGIALTLLPVSVYADREHGVQSPSFVSFNAIPVCYDFGCKTRSTVRLPLTEWEEITGWFNPAAETPAQERDQIKNAIGWMEVLIGRHTPTHKDLAFDIPKNADVSQLFPGQQDCIDEAVNTTTYLRLLELSGLLKYHTVVEQGYRKAVFDQHWAGQIKEIDTGTKYIVDSWFQPNGFLPVIQASKEWEDISIISAVVDHSERDTYVEIKKPSLFKRLFGLE